VRTRSSLTFTGGRRRTAISAPESTTIHPSLVSIAGRLSIETEAGSRPAFERGSAQYQPAVLHIEQVIHMGEELLAKYPLDLT